MDFVCNAQEKTRAHPPMDENNAIQPEEFLARCEDCYFTATIWLATYYDGGYTWYRSGQRDNIVVAAGLAVTFGEDNVMKNITDATDTHKDLGGIRAR